MNYSHPVSYASLRSLLAIVDDAAIRGDVMTLENSCNLIPPLDGDVRLNCALYINGLIKSIEYADMEYDAYREADMTAARLSLERAAFGNFDEAMHAIGQDLMSLDPAIPREIISDVFRPEFFDPEDREMWNDLRQVIDRYKECPSGDYGIEAYQAYRALREYQQKSYGPLLPAMVATYVRKNGADAEGVSARFAWVDDVLNIAAVEPLAGMLNDYFEDEYAIGSAEEFNENSLPRRVGVYELMDIACSDMYRYEL